jgi:alcohol dehydrogenase, propanol-preferring
VLRPRLCINRACGQLAIAPQAAIRTEVTRYALARANEALADLREGRLQGAAVLIR